MPYRPDFYIPENIVGYTGDLHNDPTVYFETYTEHGRITQAHHNVDNIGRNEVRQNVLFVLEGQECTLYRYEGGNIEQAGVACEFYATRDGETILDDFYHESRNPLIIADAPAIPILAAAIDLHNELKRKSRPNDRYMPFRKLIAFLDKRAG